MFGKNKAVMAIFENETEIKKVVERLKSNGFRTADLSVLLASNRGSKDFAHVKDTKAPEGATAGAATGAVVGGTLGWLAGAGALALTGIGPLIAAGPILAALAGAGAGGAVGSLTGAIVGMGFPEYEAKRFEGMIKEGKALISVHCDDSEWVTKATEILKDCGGKDIGSRSEGAATLAGTSSTRPVDMSRRSSYETKEDETVHMGL